MSSDEDKLLQTGIDAIIKAFNLKKGNSKVIINEQTKIINDLQTKITNLEEENDKLKSTFSLFQLESHQLKKENIKLHSSLEEKQKILNEYQASNIDNTTTLTVSNNNQPDVQLKQHKKDKSANPTLDSVKEKIHFLCNKKTSVVSKSNESNDGSLSHRNNNTKNIKEENKFTDIETKISQIKGNLSSRENSRNKVREDPFLSTNNIFEYPKAKYSKTSIRIPTGTKRVSMPIKDKNAYKHNDSNIYHNPSKYRLKTDFLNECNLQLTSKNFEEILSLFGNIKDGEIKQNDAVHEIRKLLQNNTLLLNLLDSLFQAD